MEETLFTLTSLLSLAAVVLILVFAQALSGVCLPKTSSQRDRVTFVWLIFDALIHFSFEGSFLYLSFPPPRTVENSTPGVFRDLWMEYAKADYRWGVSDPTIVTLELLTVLVGGPMCLYIAYQMYKGDRSRHYWIVVLSIGELYGSVMTFGPEWLTGSKNLKTDNFLHLFIYLYLMNGIWIIVPLLLAIDSFGYISLALRDPLKYAERIKIEEEALKIKAA